MLPKINTILTFYGHAKDNISSMQHKLQYNNAAQQWWYSIILVVVVNTIWFLHPEGHVTMHNFLMPLWNEGKQPHTFNSEVSPQLQVDSDNQTFLRKKTFARQKPMLWIKLVINIKFWHTFGLFLLNSWAGWEHLTSQLSWVADAE